MAWFDERWFDVVEIVRMSTNRSWVVKNLTNEVKDLFIDVSLHDMLKIKGLGKLKVEIISMQHDKKRLVLQVSKWMDNESLELAGDL